MRILFIVYDNESFIGTFPLGIAYLASSVCKAGHEVAIYNQDVHHYSEDDLADYLDQNKFDVIGVGVIAGYYQYQKLIKISETINNSKNRPSFYVIGGHGPSPEPEYFLMKTGADVVVMGEGEQTMVELLNAISDKKPFSQVDGIAFRNGKQTTVNPNRTLTKDIDSIPWPAYDMFPIEYYRLMRLPHSTNRDFIMPVLSARGCTFKCNFCYRMETGYRIRNAEAIVEEIKYLQKQYQITYIDFADELLMSSKNRVEELCRAFQKAKLKFKWYCNGRLNYAETSILKLMKDSGCVFINYGIEAFDDEVLKSMNKALTTRQILKGIETTLDAGISPGFNIIFGNIGDNEETLQKGVDFLLKHDNCAELRNIRPVTPYPGSQLYDQAITKGLLDGVDDFYNNKHINSDLLAVNFTHMSDSEFHKKLMEANITLLENYHKKILAKMVEVTRNLYLNKDTTFRGYRQT